MYPRSVEDLRALLEERDRTLVFATNAGMYEADHSPVGLHVEDGKVCNGINRRSGEGNFYLEPNGVFYVDVNAARIVPTDEWKSPDGLRIATQSGPLLLSSGVIHPAFDPGSINRYTRCGVGGSDGHTVHFALSADPVRFHDFATLFKEVLDCTDALYLDGLVSMMAFLDTPPETTPGTFSGLLLVSGPRNVPRDVPSAVTGE